MASYITGITDYIPSINNFSPDYNFLSNVLQQRQSNYDKNYNQLSSVYTSLFNSPMSREVDIQKKDAFFKSIEQDIKKVSGMDLSLQQNVDAASKVFQPFLDDKNLMNDIVKTKQNQNGVAKHHQLKSCVDPDKCGGQAWDTGLQEQIYKLEEFKNTTDEEALNFNMPEYTPKYVWQKDAEKLAKDRGYSVTQEYPSGPWIVKESNGRLVQGGLYNLYKNTYGEDPRVSANYKTESYVQRKNFVANAVSQGQNEEFAERTYANEIINNSESRLKKMHNEFYNIHEKITEKQNNLKNKEQGQGLLPEETDILVLLEQKKGQVANSQKALEVTSNGITNNSDSTDINVLRARADNAAAFELEERDLYNMASNMASLGAKREISANPFVLAETNARNSRILADINHQYRLKEQGIKHVYDMDLKYGQVNPEGNTIPEQITPIAATTQDIDDKALKLRNDIKHTHDEGVRSDGLNRNLILGMVNQIKQAATSAKNHSTNANYILEQNFGKEWSSVKLGSDEEIQKYLTSTGKSSDVILSNLKNALNKKNNPEVDVDWAQPYMEKYGHAFQTAQELQLNYQLLNKDARKNWKNTVDSMQKQSSENILFVNSDLLLSPKGDIISKPEFKQKYDNYYSSRGIDGGDANKVYDVLNTKFLDEYNKTVPSWNQAVGQPIGGNTTTSPGVMLRNVSANRPLDTGFTQSMDIIKQLTGPNEIGGITAVVGSEFGGDNPLLKNVVKNFISDNIPNVKGQTGVKPIFDFAINPVDAEGRSSVAITVRNPEEYFKNQFGTIKSPKPLDPYKDILTSGEPITLFFDDKITKIPMIEESRMEDPIIGIVRSQNVVLNSWPEGGEMEFSYNPSDQMVTVTGTYVDFNKDGSKKDQQGTFESFPINQMPQKRAYWSEILAKNQKHVKEVAEPYIREQSRNK